MTRRTTWLGLRALVGLALLAAPAWVLATAGGAVPHQHWTLGALLAVSALAGVALLVATALAWRRDRRRATAPPATPSTSTSSADTPRSGVTGASAPSPDAEPAARPEPARPRGRRVLRATGAGVGLALLAVLAAATAWLRPFPATDAALDALRGDDAVEVRESAGWYAFVPRDAEPTTGLVYSPGARVDVRATAAVLRPLAEAGYLVVALKEPLGIALTSPGQSASAMAAFDGVERWAVGGHSLGGVAASSFAAAHDDEVDGLLLHASYPLGDMVDADLVVASVSGSEDGLTTPADVDASRADLPAATTFTQVDGAVHAFFADYGPQPGDGTPTVPREEARAEIVAASLALLDEVAAG
ncbi:alpha/beta hydrolase [Cellulomonas sp. PS-H5]|uniref:alpha/beta hydrolase n=1 Tax=Cellulomonas sp. PS-H5 TaxID=2820400 RepID=UPI001C4FDCC8|nr:alpha/beta hydrolase [Cellulomonas sp. PS-H5]MBW0254648.1 alpha/beta hydrolase [Cellulomonas sp. PS-H5]